MEHLQGEIKLELGGRKRTLFFDYTFVSLLNQYKTEAELQAMFEAEPFRIIPVLAYYALLAGDDLNELPEGFSERTVGRWLMVLPPDQHTLILESYRAAMGFMTAVFQPLLENAAAQNKKQAGKK